MPYRCRSTIVCSFVFSVLAICLMSACGSGLQAVANETWSLVKLLSTGERIDTIEEVTEVRNCGVAEHKTIECSAGTSNDISVGLGGGAPGPFSGAIEADIISVLGIGRYRGETLTLDSPPEGYIYRYKVKTEFHVKAGEMLARSSANEERKAAYVFNASCSLRLEPPQLVACQEGAPLPAEPAAISQPSISPTTPIITSTPTPTRTPTPTKTSPPEPIVKWRKIYDASTMEGWPDWCVKPANNGKPMRQLSASEYDSTCFNESFNQTLADFAVEWTVGVDGRAALLVFGQDNKFYWIGVRAGEGFLGIQQVLDFNGGKWKALGDVYPSTIHTKSGALNTIRATRLGSTITFSVNGENVKVIPDALFGGQSVPLKVGFGAAVGGNAGTTVYLEELGVYTR